jgi:tetratricopeptide (TPR) repeat protein
MQRFVLFVAMLMVGVNAPLQTAAQTGGASSAFQTKAKIKELTQTIKSAPRNAQTYADRAAAKAELNDMYGAIKDYTAAISLSTAAQPDFLTGRANAFLEIGAFKEALRDFETTLQHTASPQARYGRAVAKYYLDDYFGAIRDLDAVVAAVPQHPKALYNRAIARLELNQLEAAISDLGAFLSYHPGHPEALSALAVASNQLEKHRLAVR